MRGYGATLNCAGGKQLKTKGEGQKVAPYQRNQRSTYQRTTNEIEVAPYQRR